MSDTEDDLEGQATCVHGAGPGIECLPCMASTGGGGRVIKKPDGLARAGYAGCPQCNGTRRTTISGSSCYTCGWVDTVLLASADEIERLTRDLKHAQQHYETFRTKLADTVVQLVAANKRITALVREAERCEADANDLPGSAP